DFPPMTSQGQLSVELCTCLPVSSPSTPRCDGPLFGEVNEIDLNQLVGLQDNAAVSAAPKFLPSGDNIVGHVDPAAHALDATDTTNACGGVLEQVESYSLRM